MWAKFESLAEGARLASKELWGRGLKKKAAKKAAPKKRPARAAKKRRTA